MIYNINKFTNIKFKFNICNNNLYIHSDNPNKFISKKYEFISLNQENIIYNNKEYDINYFIQYIYNKKYIYLVLTNEEVFVSKFKVKSYFQIFPFIKNQKFENLTILEKYKILINLKNETFYLFDNKYKSIQHQYKTYLAFKQNKKIHYKSTLDNNFFFAIKPGFADVFKLLENRSNRSIFQLDVNSMYPFAMIQSNFSIPSKLEYHKENDLNDILNDTITNGIFNCILSIKKDLSNKNKNFIKYLPINIVDNNISIPLHIKYGDEVNILLHANEIKYYSKYFDIIIEDGIYSKYSITHPLKNWILDTYQKRLDSSGDLKDFYKFILTVSHSVIMGKSMKSEYYDSNNINNILLDEYQYKILDYEFENSYFKFNVLNDDLIKGLSYNINNNQNVYSLYSQVLANARIHLLELYEKFYYESSSFELCYCNIDSLHISIPNELQEQFDLILNQISSKTELGKLKIESISNRGIWFEPGRYWLFKDNQLVSYKNTIFNDNNDDYKCTFKKIEYINKNGFYNVNYFSLFKSLQHKKNIIKENNLHYVFKKDNNGNYIDLINNKINNDNLYRLIFIKFIKY